MLKTKLKKKFFRLVHLEALVVVVAYFIVSNFVLVSSVANKNILISFLVPLVFG